MNDNSVGKPTEPGQLTDNVSFALIKTHNREWGYPVLIYECGKPNLCWLYCKPVIEISFGWDEFSFLKIKEDDKLSTHYHYHYHYQIAIIPRPPLHAVEVLQRERRKRPTRYGADRCMGRRGLRRFRRYGRVIVSGWSWDGGWWGQTGAYIICRNT